MTDTPRLSDEELTATFNRVVGWMPRLQDRDDAYAVYHAATTARAILDALRGDLGWAFEHANKAAGFVRRARERVE